MVPCILYLRDVFLPGCQAFQVLWIEPAVTIRINSSVLIDFVKSEILLNFVSGLCMIKDCLRSNNTFRLLKFSNMHNLFCFRY